FDLRSATEEAEYFPLPRQLRALVTRLQGLVEAGVAARVLGESPLLDGDRELTAAEALGLISALAGGAGATARGGGRARERREVGPGQPHHRVSLASCRGDAGCHSRPSPVRSRLGGA